MPYTLKFNGNFFHVADFIEGARLLVKTENSKVAVDGRLITINGFSLEADPEDGFPKLEGDLLHHHLPDAARARASPRVRPPTGPAPATATPASTTTGGAP